MMSAATSAEQASSVTADFTNTPQARTQHWRVRGLVENAFANKKIDLLALGALSVVALTELARENAGLLARWIFLEDISLQKNLQQQ